MADDLDKFVLQYTVELRDSIAKLEKLNEKMGGVGAASKKSGGEVKKFAADASNELGKLVPGLNAVSSAVKMMGAEFAAATAALGALALGVKMVMNLREQYNQQRSDGMQLGVSSIRMEEYQRKFVKSSGGYVTRDAAAEGIKSFASMANSAYADPSRLGREARIMRQYLGVDVGARGAPSTPLNTELTQLAQGLQGKSRGDVQGIAKATGLNQDWLLTVQKLGPSIGKITEMTGAEIEKRQQAEGSLSKFNDQLSQLKEKFVEVSNELAEPLLPLMSQLVKAMQALAEVIPKVAHNTANNVEKLGPVGGDPTKKGAWRGSILNSAISLFNGDAFKKKEGTDLGIIDTIMGSLGLGNVFAAKPKPVDEAKKQQETKAAADKRDAAVGQLDEASKQGIQTANDMALAINMFAGAVQSFSSAVNIQQAWAAWAGEIGKAGGLPGSSTNIGSYGGFQGGGNGTWDGSAYAKQIKAASDVYKVDPQMIYSIMMAESSGVNGKYSATGAGGLMQVTKGNWKAYGGGADVMDPASNIMVGARIYSEFLAKSKGNIQNALNGYNGNSDPDYLAKVNRFYGGGSGGIGESKVKIQQRQVQQAIASYLNVPLSQIQRGGVSQGDAAWASQQLQNGVANNITSLKQQLSVAGLPAQNYARLQMELRDQSRGLDLLRQYAPGIVDREPAGERQRTIGERPIIININGATDPKEVAAEVNNQLTKAMNDLIMEHSTGQKG
jgi:hypothetical protein